MKTFNDEIQARSFLEEKEFTITWNHVILLPNFIYELTDYEADAINFLYKKCGYDIGDDYLKYCFD
jgi:hypothetical protein